MRQCCPLHVCTALQVAEVAAWADAAKQDLDWGVTDDQGLTPLHLAACLEVCTRLSLAGQAMLGGEVWKVCVRVGRKMQGGQDEDHWAGAKTTGQGKDHWVGMEGWEVCAWEGRMLVVGTWRWDVGMDGQGALWEGACGNG